VISFDGKNPERQDIGQDIRILSLGIIKKEMIIVPIETVKDMIAEGKAGRWGTAVERVWGFYDIIANFKNTKVKELVVKPNTCLSFQRHKHRSEFWLVNEGIARVILSTDYQESCSRGDLLSREELIEQDCWTVVLRKHEYLHIPVGEWHQLINPSNKELSIIEIQYGDMCEEQDIERLYQ
jgi:mannose-6-phosphate isomerase-like protein (cupin superfamily)